MALTVPASGFRLFLLGFVTALVVSSCGCAPVEMARVSRQGLLHISEIPTLDQEIVTYGTPFPATGPVLRSSAEAQGIMERTGLASSDESQRGAMRHGTAGMIAGMVSAGPLPELRVEDPLTARALPMLAIRELPREPPLPVLIVPSLSEGSGK